MNTGPDKAVASTDPASTLRPVYTADQINSIKPDHAVGG